MPACWAQSMRRRVPPMSVARLVSDSRAPVAAWMMASIPATALHRIDVAARLAAEDAGAVARLAQEHDHMSPERSGPAGDEDVHFLPSCSPKKVTTRRHASS